MFDFATVAESSSVSAYRGTRNAAYAPRLHSGEHSSSRSSNTACTAGSSTREQASRQTATAAHHFSPHQPSAMPFICSPLGGALIWLADDGAAGDESGVFLTAGVMCAYPTTAFFTTSSTAVRA